MTTREDEMVERVARAMWESSVYGSVKYEHATAETLAPFRTAARSAITALSSERDLLREALDKVVSCGCCDEELYEVRKIIDGTGVTGG